MNIFQRTLSFLVISLKVFFEEIKDIFRLGIKIISRVDLAMNYLIY